MCYCTCVGVEDNVCEPFFPSTMLDPNIKLKSLALAANGFKCSTISITPSMVCFNELIAHFPK